MIWTDGGEEGFNSVLGNEEENPTVAMMPVEEEKPSLTENLIQKRRLPEALINTNTTEYNPEVGKLLGSNSLTQLVSEIREKSDKRMMVAQDIEGEKTVKSMTYEDLLKAVRRAIKTIDSNSQNPLKALQEVPSFSFDSETWGANFRKVLLGLYVNAKNTEEGKKFIKDFISEA